MKIAAVSMVRNEVDILPAFVNHNAQFVDAFYFADHRSTDGTSALLEMLSHSSNLGGHTSRSFQMRSTQYFQREVCRCLADVAFSDRHDWVIFLDADEFIRHRNRGALEDALRGIASGIAALQWRNLIPTDAATRGPFRLDQAFTEPAVRRNPPNQKIALSRDFAARYPFYRLTEGNHSVELAPGLRSIGGDLVGELGHVPIRSEAQAQQKVKQMLDGIRQQQRTMSHLQYLSSLLSTEVDEKSLLTAAVSLYEGPPEKAIGNGGLGPRRFFEASPAYVPESWSKPSEGRAVFRDGSEDEALLPYGRVRVRERNGVMIAERLPFAAARQFTQRTATRLHPRRLKGVASRLMNRR